MLPATAELRQPAVGSPASRCATPPVRRGRRGHGARAESPHPPPRYANIVGKTASAGDNTNLDQCRSEIQRDVRLMAQKAGTANLPLQAGQVPLMTRLRMIFRQCPGTFRVWPGTGGSVLSSFQDVPSSAAVNNSAMTANCRARSAAASALSRLSASSSSCSSCSSNSSCPLM
jgi:hypothetical protein